MALAEQLKLLMEARGWSARRLSIEAGLNENFVQDILAGRSQHPRSDNLGKLANALGVSVDQLLSAESPIRGSTDPRLLRLAYNIAAKVMTDEPSSEGLHAYAAVFYDTLLEHPRFADRELIQEDEVLRFLTRLLGRIRRIR